MKKIFRKEFVIGACVIATLLILVFGIDYLKGINVFKAANYYYVSYTDVAGLAQSAPVTINGYKVGLVREINYEYDNPGHVIVELSLDKKLRLTQGTKAVLTTDMLGTATIKLEMAPGNDFHIIGDKLVGVNEVGLMDNVTGDILPGVVNMLPKIDSMLVSLQSIAANPALHTSIDRLDDIMANVETATNALSVTMRNVAPVSSQLPTLVGNVDQITANLATASEDLAALAADIQKMPLDSTVNSLCAITQNLEQITTALNSRNSSLGMLIYDPSLYNNLDNTAAHLDSILIDLKRQPKKYIPAIKVF